MRLALLHLRSVLAATKQERENRLPQARAAAESIVGVWMRLGHFAPSLPEQGTTPATVVAWIERELRAAYNIPK